MLMKLLHEFIELISVVDGLVEYRVQQSTTIGTAIFQPEIDDMCQFLICEYLRPLGRLHYPQF
jgi:hypothetical protein